ncbi:MAG: hypothetical protein HC883_01775, partial [Bdellovibrionaceae bacterium]|nr:hypothetical protein [Pseudobdellovibrionaceae bacterium]
MSINNPDEEGPFPSIRNIAVDEGESCKTIQLQKYLDNGVSFSCGWGEKKTEAEAVKEVETIEK